MKELNLKVEKRDGLGKGNNRRLRSDGIIPAVVYGPDSEPLAIKVNYRELYRTMHGTPLSTIINLDIEGDAGPARKVLIREIQKDPLTGELIHLDFHNIAMDKPITLTIPVRTTGMPIGVKNYGGIVQMVRREIDVSCLPTNIPDDILLDITNLDVGDSLHVSDITLENVDILTDTSRTIVTVVAPTVIKETAEAAEGEAVVAEGAAAEGEAAEGEAKEGEAKKGEAKKGDEKKKDGDKKK